VAVGQHRTVGRVRMGATLGRDTFGHGRGCREVRLYGPHDRQPRTDHRERRGPIDRRPPPWFSRRHDDVPHDNDGEARVAVPGKTDLDPQYADAWMRRWDAQQEGYIADREERFTVVADVVEHATRDNSAPVIVDLGAGPGSLAGRLAHRIPAAQLIAVDADPVLLALGHAHYGSSVRFVDADLSDPSWPESAELPQQVDAAVSSTALHWLDPKRLADLYARLATHIRPGGVFVNADHLRLGGGMVEEFAERARETRAERVGDAGNEGWRDWWDAVLADNLLAPLVQERSQRAIQHGGSENEFSVQDHTELLRKVGFSEVGAVWQSGDDHVLVAVR